MVLAFSLNGQEIKDSTNFETIVITDSKIEKPTKRSTKNIITISAREIQESSYSRLGDVLDQINGITVNGATSNPGKDQIIYTQGTESDFTLFLLDGQPIHDPSSIGGSFDLRLLNLSQVDRIEILKGNQSVLYGSDAVAGVINIISKNPDDVLNASVNAEYGSFNTINLGGSVSGKADRINYFLQGRYSDSEGISEAEDESGNSDFDKDGYDKLNLDAGLAYQLTKNWDIKFTGNITDWNSMYDDGAFTDGTSAYDASVQRYAFSSLYQKENKSLSVLLARTSSERIFKTEFGDFVYEGLAWNGDIFGSSQINDKFYLTIGYQFQDNESLTDIADMIIHSPYLNLNYDLSSSVKLEAGYRYTDNSDFGTNHDYSLSASYFPNSDTRVYANWSTGFKAPLLAQLYGPFGANPNLKAQKSKSLQAGIEYEKHDNILGVNFFYYDFSQLIIFSPEFLYDNLDEAHNYGIEINDSYRFSEKLKAGFSYVFLNGERETTTGGVQTEKNNLLRRPKHQIDVSLNYAFNEKLQARINTRWVGERTDTYFNPASFETSDVNLDPYLLLDLSLNFKQNNHLKWFLNIRNITDVHYYEVYGFSPAPARFRVGVNAGL